MQRGSFRVRGCGRCKARKVKCDNKIPSCSQCLRLKKPCPVAESGPIFFNMVASLPVPSPIMKNYGFMDEVSRLAVEVGSHHVSPGTPDPWFLFIPQLHLTPELARAILCPFQAMSLAFKSFRIDDSRLRRKALESYHQGLVEQRNLLGLTYSKKGPTKESIFWALLMAVSLLNFEMIAPSSPFAWFDHALGATHLLSMLTPETCQKSPYFEIYRHLRYMMSYVTMLTNRTSCLGESAWLDVPYQEKGKSQVGLMLDAILAENNSCNPGQHMLDPASTSVTDRSRLGQATRTGQETTTAVDSEQLLLQLLGPVLAHIVSIQEPSMLTAEALYTSCDAIMAEAEALLLQPSTPFNISLQAMFSMKLVSKFSQDKYQKQVSSAHFDTWHRLLTMRDP